MEKFAITVIGKNILRSAVRVMEKLSTKLNKPKLNHLLLTNHLFLDTITLQKNSENLVHISQIKNEPSDWNITLSPNGTPISYEINTGAQCNVIVVKN